MKPQSCPRGHTNADLKEILGPRLEEFWSWMTGQTMMLCDGKAYHHDRKCTPECVHPEGGSSWTCKYLGTGFYYATECSGLPEGTLTSRDAALTGHGAVTYPWDLERFMTGLPVIDLGGSMQRKFELEGILAEDESDVTRFSSLERAQQEPWHEEYLYRMISEMEVPDHPLMEPLVLNVWYQGIPNAEWRAY
jgi:hypothetical protein